MLTEALEFLIAQYADGTLPLGERASVEDRLRVDPAARAALEAYRAVDAALKAGDATRWMDELDWEARAGAISAAVGAAGAGAVSESAEFGIAGLADGTLEGLERDAVEALVTGDLAARALLHDYRTLDRVLESAAREHAPPMAGWDGRRWDALAERISRTVTAAVAGAGEGGMAESAEAAIAAYVDGSLPQTQRAAVEEMLGAQPAARLLAAEYAVVDAALSELKDAPRPDVRWDQLSASISQAVDRTGRAASSDSGSDGAGDAEAAGVRDRRSFRLFALPRPPARWLAAAASVLLVIGLGVAMLRPGGWGLTSIAPTQVAVNPTPPVVAPPPGPEAGNPKSFTRVTLVGPPAVAAAGQVKAHISIGPGPAFSRAGEMQAYLDYADDAASRQTRTIVVASGAPAGRGDWISPF